MIHSVLRRCLLSDLKTPAHSRRYLRRLAALLLVAVSLPLAAQERPAEQDESQDTVTRSPEEVYQSLMAMTGDEQAVAAFDAIKAAGRELNPEEAHELEFTGNLRFLPARPAQTEADPEGLYLIRSLAGEIYIVLTPEDTPDLDTSAYADLQDKIKNKMIFQVAVNDTIVDGVVYHYVRLTAPPQREPLDAAFFYFIVAMLFLVMLGMGMTLRPRDFSMIVLKPRGMLVGPICQFGLLPALAALLGTLVGYREEFPFMFVGLILITSSPGGVTSNLMTYWAKGDLALSVSMTAISTVLSLIMTPFLLGVYADGIPGVVIPTGEVIKQILALVILPLAVGMTIRWKAENFAKKSEKVFSALGVFALLFLIITGVLNNLHTFADTSRYGLKFYAMIFGLTVCAMFFSLTVSRLLGVSNFQTRAITLETGLQNAALAMTIAILLQDRMGDFHSSMFAVSGLYGLWMYVAGALMIAIFPKLLPVDLHFHITDGSAQKSGGGK